MKKIILLLLLLLVALYFFGPKPNTPVYASELPDLPTMPEALETYVMSVENRHKLKKDNEAEIIWANPATKGKTPIAVVYLHGFSASKREGFPTHVKFANRYGCNLYLARLSDHGIDTTDALYRYTPDRVWRSAVEAYAIGTQLGNEVIIMSTSTGGTLALKLAATFPKIKGIINFSPNLAINDPAAFLLNDPWGLQVARLSFGSDFRELECDETYKRYWYHRYRLESVVALQELVETIAHDEIYEKVTCPVFSGVFYRDENNQDPVVKVEAVREMHKALGTVPEKQMYVEFPDANTHVIACDIQSQSLSEVMDSVFGFAENVLLLKPVDPKKTESF